MKSKLLLVLLLTSLFSFLSYYFESPDDNFYGADIYIGFSFLYFLIIQLFIIRVSYSPRLVFFLTGLLFLGAQPLFENDHYRYLWEGKVIKSGFSPYELAPNKSQLDDVRYEKRHKIAYNKLTSIYPPLSQALFLTVSPLRHDLALLCLQILFFLAILWILPMWFESSNTVFLLLLPFLLKEFVQSIHIDLLAVIFFTLSLSKLSKSFYRGSYLFSFLSFYSKILSIITLPFILIKQWRKTGQLSWVLLIFPAGVVLFYLFIPFESSRLSGTSAYIKNWHWNSFFMESSLRLGIEFVYARLALLAGFAISYFILLISYLRKTRNTFVYLRLSFGFLFLFSPVVHPWYVLWLLPLIKDRKEYAYYIASTVLAYIPYSNLNFEYLFSGLQLLVLCYAMREDILILVKKRVITV